MTYHIRFTYDGHFGRSEGYVYTRTKAEALEKIKEHLADKSQPKLIKWRLYELIEEGAADGN